VAKTNVPMEQCQGFGRKRMLFYFALFASSLRALRLIIPESVAKNNVSMKQCLGFGRKRMLFYFALFASSLPALRLIICESVAINNVPINQCANGAMPRLRQKKDVILLYALCVFFAFNNL
jgi:hypothetical protein